VHIKQIKKIAIRILLSLLLIMVVVSILFSISSVQTRLGKRATNYLQKEFDVAIAVNKIDLSFLGSVQLKDVLIKNHHADTLIYVNNLSTSVLSFRDMVASKLEFGKISVSNFILNLKTYEGETDDALTIFIDKFNDGKNNKKPSGFLLTSNKLNLKNGYVTIVDENIVKDLKIQGPNVSANIIGVSFTENNAVKVQKLSSEFTYTKKFMKFLNTNIETETSSILVDLEFKYKREYFSDFNNKVNLEATIKKAEVSLIDLQKFYAELGTTDVLHFSTKITGTLNNFTTHNLQLISDKNTVLNGTLNFKNAFNKENGFSIEGNITNLISDYYHLKALLPNVFGENISTLFKKFGQFSTNGTIYITENLIDAQLHTNTNIGAFSVDLELADITNIKEVSYIGNIEINNLELGKIIGDTLIGKLSINVAIDGEGFTLEKLNTSVKGLVSKYQYKNYTYTNISLNGVVKNKHFNGEMEVNDANIKLNFNGLADFSTEVYTFDFKTTVDYCDLNTLNLFKRDSISNITGEINIKVKGNSLNDLVGTVNFKNTSYTNQKDNYFFKDFNITSSFTDSIRTVSVNSSEIIEGRIKGKFTVNELGKLTQNAIGSIYTNYIPFEVKTGQYLDFRFKIYNKIIEVFYPEVTLSANTSIRGKLNSDDNLFKLTVKSPKVEAYSTIINNLNLQIDNKNPLFNTHLSIDKVKAKQYNISNLNLINITLNDTLYFRTEFTGGKQNTEKYNLSFYHTINKENKSIFGVQKSNFTFKNNKWYINPNNNNLNKIVFDNVTKNYNFKTFTIASNKQEIEFSGEINDSISKNLKFYFKNVQLAKVTPKVDSLSLQGIINGELNYTQINEQIKPTARLSISNFYINNSYQGNLEIDIAGKNSVKKYSINTFLNRNNATSFSAVGTIDFTPIKPILDINIDFEKFKLNAFSPLGKDVLTNIRGYAYGNIHATGLLSNPTMEGNLFLDQAGLYFPYLNVDYNFEGTSVIALKKQSFILEDVTLKDNAHNTKGKLTGTISHTYFDDWRLDLTINTTNLLVLNTVEEENAVYFGTGFLEGIATIKGLTDRLIIDITGKTQKGTYFVIPISNIKTAESSQLIRFVNKNKLEDNEEIRRAFISENLKGMSLNFNMEITKDAIVEIVLDKATGSYLKGSGTGNLQIELDTKDKFEMYGDFSVDNGIYNFKYGGFINKPFKVKKGGTISWNGDPLTAIINIEAIHRVSANPRTLLENITTNRRIPIHLITRFSGELLNSQRSFDIEIPSASSTVASELAFKLNDNDKNSKTRHFVSLLTTGAFYNENNFSINTSGLVYGTASDMLSNAFDNIFNQGNNRFKLKPVYTVGERNKVDNLDIDDQLAIALDYQVNDRIIINGKVGMPIGSKEQTSVIGEVNVEFLLNQEGTLRSSIFNRQNEIQYTEEEEGYTQGIGIAYQIDFNTSRELLEKLGLKKKKIKDTILNAEPKNILKINNKLINFKNKKTTKNE